MVKSRLYLATLFAVFLATSACDKDVRIEVLPQPTEVLIPAQNRSCASIPTPPNPDVSTQQDVAAWIPEVYGAHAECRSDLRAVNRIVDGHNAEAQRVAAENAAKVEAAD